MKATLAFVPPGGGETDYSQDFEIPAIPRAGDYVSVKITGEEGLCHFIVRRVWWGLEYPKIDPRSDVRHTGRFDNLMIECEFADEGPYPSENHKRACKMYIGRDKPMQKFENTCY